MVENKSNKMHNAGSSDCHSLCSNQSGRFRKVSIGITVEKYPRMGSGVKEDGAALPNRERASLSQGKVVEENGEQVVEEIRGPEIVEKLEVKQVESKDQKASAWFSSRSVRHETPITETIQFYANKASVVQSKDGMHKKLDTIAYGKREKEGGNIERVEEVAYTAIQEIQLLDKRIGREEPEKVVKCNNEALRMKIWEILGTAPSQSKHTMNSLNIEEEKENSKINQNRTHQRAKVAQPKHNSDSIETDSESPNLTMRRPVTRSLTRKRAPPKTVCKLHSSSNNEKKPISSSGSDSKTKLPEKNIFAFDDGARELGSLKRTATSHSNRIKVKSNEQKKTITEPRRIHTRKPLVSRKGLQPNVKEQKLPSPDKASLQSKETGISPSPPWQDKEDFMRIPNMQKKARTEPHKIYSAKKLVPESNLQSNEREQTLTSPDKASLQSEETGRSSSPSCQGKKDFMQTSSLQGKAKVESRRIYSPIRLVSEKNLQPDEREQTLSSPDKAPVRSKDVANDSHHSQTYARGDFGNLPFSYNEETRDPLQRKKEHSWEHVTSPPEPKGSNLEQKVVSPPSEKISDLLGDFPSPTLAMNATPPSLSSTKLVDEVFSSPVLAKPRIPTRKTYSTNFSGESRPGSCGSDANIDTDDTRKIHESQDTEFEHMKEKETGNKSSLSPMEDQDTENTSADLTRKGLRETDKWFPDAGSHKKSPYTRSKNVCSSKSAIQFSGFRQDENWFLGAGSPKKAPFTLRQSKGVNSLKRVELRTEETTVSHKTSEKHPENSLERDVVELALVLERFKGKLKLHTSNKSSEILSAAAEKIHLQLQDVESQMLADVGKFISMGKSKRKRFESRLQGQQERLRIVHDKFKEEVNQQLQDCRSTVEELEAHRMELKGSTDRQKASHRKLLLQVEEAMKAEMRDAETRIAAIDKEARKKMYGLKHVLKEWMEDGVIR